MSRRVTARAVALHPPREVLEVVELAVARRARTLALVVAVLRAAVLVRAGRAVLRAVLALLAVALLAFHLPESAYLKWSGWLMITGIVIFSSSLYGLSLSGIRWLGAIAPIGGTAFIAAWLLLIIAVLKAP